MKKNVFLTMGIALLILSFLLVAGCAKKKAMVTSDVTPATDTVAEQTVETTQPDAAISSGDITDRRAADREQWVDLEQKAAVQSPVRHINFDFDSSTINAEAREILNANAEYFKTNRVYAIIIEGHCDERGTAEYNMALGERRAQETKRYLVNLGVKEAVIKTVSFGEELPLDPASNEDAWAQNRRANFVVNP